MEPHSMSESLAGAVKQLRVHEAGSEAGISAFIPAIRRGDLIAHELTREFPGLMAIYEVVAELSLPTFWNGLWIMSLEAATDKRGRATPSAI